MSRLSLTEAAAAAGVSPKTIQRKVTAGILSVSRAPDGRRYIDASELIRVFPEAWITDFVQETGPDMSGHGQPGGDMSGQIETAVELAKLRQQVMDLQARVEELRVERDDWKRTAQQLLPGPRRSLLDRLVEALGRIRGKG